ncbi:MAG: Wzz/FepE/Etk N-terminal domain-containing protein, partial [Pseudomonadota bacterium]
MMQLLGMLWRGKWLILLTMILFGTAALMYLTQVAVPKYRAMSVVALQSRAEQVVDFENVISGLSGDQASINTEVEVLRARGLLEKLVIELNLEADPEFNKFIKPKTIWSAQGMIDEVKDVILGPQPEVVPSPRKIRDETTDALLKRLDVTNIRRSYAFQISVITEDPEKSAKIADTLAELYIADQVNTKFKANERATSWLADQLTQLETDLETAENAVKEFSAITDLVSPEALAIRNRQLKDFRDREADLRLQKLDHDQSVTEMVEARRSGNAKTMLQVSGDSALGTLYNRMSSGRASDVAAFQRRFDELIAARESEQIRFTAQLSTMQKSIQNL